MGSSSIKEDETCPSVSNPLNARTKATLWHHGQGLPRYTWYRPDSTGCAEVPISSWNPYVGLGVKIRAVGVSKHLEVETTPHNIMCVAPYTHAPCWRHKVDCAVPSRERGSSCPPLLLFDSLSRRKDGE